MISNNNIIHIFDDDKFIDSSIKLIESVYPNQSKYFVVKNTDSAFRYVKSSKVERLSLKNTSEIINFSEYILENEVKAVFFHALNDYKQELAIQLPNSVVKVWFIWGYDLYGKWPLLKKNIYEKKTAQFLGQNKKRIRNSIKNRLIFNDFSFQLFLNSKKRSFLIPYKIRGILNNNYSTRFYLAAQKMDIVVPVVPTEFSLVERMGLKGIYSPFNYGCLEDLLGDKLELNVLKAKNILIGNSGDPTNNHVDVFKRIAKLDLKDKKIFVPLSYSGSKEYVDFVIEKGYYYFGDNFVPLTDFIPLEKYNEILGSCGFMIFNHIRQQGVGNIITLGYMGAKLFLNKKSPVYSYYKNLGLDIYCVEEVTQSRLNINLTQEQYNNNNNKFFENYSESAVQNKIVDLFGIVDSVHRKKNDE